MKPQPSQYDIDNMKDGDIVYVFKRSLLYKWYRRNFLNDKVKVKVKNKDANGPYDYKEFYQEDCIIIYKFELVCQTTLENNIPYFISDNVYKPTRQRIFKRVLITLYNIQFVFADGFVVTVPLDRIQEAIKLNNDRLLKMSYAEELENTKKYMQYNGEFFKKKVKENKIRSWTPSYCTICGKPITFKFKTDKIEVLNKCSCGNNSLSVDKLSYEDFALWYASQKVPLVKEQYDKFWFHKE